MKAKKTLTLDEIFEKVKSYDLVLTAEASLADAINNRINKPRLGKLAYTPKNLIRRNFQNEILNQEKELFQELIGQPQLNWKEASHLLGIAVDYWEDTGSLDGFTKKSNLEEEKLNKILPILKNTTSIYREMEDYRVSEDKKTCVVGLYQFTGLDKSVLPDTYERIEFFKDEKTELPTFRVFSSASQVVGATVDNILSLGGDSTAVVIHPDSVYNSLLRSYLRSENIEFQVARTLQESDSLRTFLEILTISPRCHRLKLKEVKPLMEKLGKSVPKAKEEEFLAKTDSRDAREFYNYLQKTKSYTFGEVLEGMKEKGFEPESKLEDVLKDLRLWSEPTTRSAVNDLKYFLDSFSVKVDESDRGVLLVNPGAVAYIDRPVVFYLGMSSKWDLKVDDRPWRNKERTRERNLNNFEALVQNGDEQLYLVQNSRLNREVTPSTYFNEFDPDLSSFTDGKADRDYVLQKRDDPERKNFNPDYVSAIPERVTAISKTGLNELAQCPRDHFFSCLIEKPDRDYFRKGNVFHEFAEFYANFPGLVGEIDRDDLLDLMIERMRSIIDDEDIPGLRTEFRLGILLLERYFESHSVESMGNPEAGYRPSKEENYFARKFDKELERKFTEMVFLNEEIGARGKVDLLNGNDLVDYKTGKKSSAGQVVKKSNPDLFDEEPDFQALLYLAHQRKVKPDKKLNFTFLHVTEDPGSILRGDFNLNNYVTTVTYYPRIFSDFLESDEVFEAAMSSKTRKKLLDPLGKEVFLQVLSKLDIDSGDFYSKQGADKYREEFVNSCREYLDVGRGKDLTENQLKKATGSILRTTLRRLRTRNYFEEDVDKFERFLEGKIEDLNVWRRTRFPVGDKDLEKANNRDLILGGEGR